MDKYYPKQLVWVFRKDNVPKDNFDAIHGKEMDAGQANIFDIWQG